MLRVTQGHERGIGLEIFLKAFLCLPHSSKKEFILYCREEDLRSTLQTCLPQFKIENETLNFYGSALKLKLLSGNGKSTSLALHKALGEIEQNDVLVTLPSSKDQIELNTGENSKGHTDLFRKLYPNSHIVMSFISPSLNAALLTDHVALKEVESALTTAHRGLVDAINGLGAVREICEVFIAGVDPHCGENGLIGSFDNEFRTMIERAKKSFKNIKIYGPLPADTILFNVARKDRLFIFPSHDQGLGPFKLLNGLTGINLTLGLPFKRVSVDHGTAFDLYGKNRAEYQGMIYLLNEVLSWKRK